MSVMTDWPGGADVAVSLTFDVDAEAGWLGRGEAYARRLTMLSEGRYGAVRGLPRLLAILARAGVPATFYVPGDTAERHTEALLEVIAGGHEIGHHGYLHLRSDSVSPETQREEILRGTAALQERLGVTPRGYRSPSWELTPETFELLVEQGFAYDSSCMGDDRPYIERYGELEILELPVHWSLDDWPHFAWHPEPRGTLTAPSAFLEVWLAEFESALAERRHVTYTMHPEVIGRGHRAALLEQMIAAMRERATVWFATHDEVARLVAE
jgi:peptidoglycan/xylan/chitin deacetylase (PgdA/CDA1 family)